MRRWLQSIIDHRHADAVLRVKTADVGIDVGAAHLELFIACVPVSAMDKKDHRPFAGFGQIQIEFMVRRFAGVVWGVANIINDLAGGQFRFAIEEF